MGTKAVDMRTHGWRASVLDMHVIRIVRHESDSAWLITPEVDKDRNRRPVSKFRAEA
jgi:hypothetical protein